MKKFLYIIVIVLLGTTQHIKGADKWEVYNTYKTYDQLEEFNGQLYVRSGSSVFVTDMNAVSTNSINQLDGLTDSSVQFLAKSESSKILAFVHADGIIDIMNEAGRITSIYDLKNKSLVGDKTINNAIVCGQMLYLACGFGFVEIDLSKQLISQYHFTDSECEFAFSYKNGIYYSLSIGGLWRCDINKNLSLDNNWKQIEDKRLLDVVNFGSDSDNQCWIIDQNKDIHILNPDGSYRKTSTRKCYEHLKHSGNYVFSKGWGFDIIKADNQEISYVQISPYSACRDYVAIDDSTIYATHPTQGLIKLSVIFNNRNHAQITQLSEKNDYFEIAGNQISELAYCNGVLAAISGYKMYNKGYTTMFLANASVNFFENGEWYHVSEENVQKMPLARKEFRGLTNIVGDPTTPHRFYVSTLTTSIYQFDGDSLTKHLNLQKRITAIDIDDEGILWAANAIKDSTIWSYDPDTDNWTFHEIKDFNQQSNIGRLFRQKNEQHRLVWALNNYPYRHSRIGILYNTTAKNGDTSQDQSASITTFQDQDGNQYSLSTMINTVFDMHEDKTGKIWLLTNIGPFVVEDVIKTFNYAQKNPGIGLVKRIKVPRNDGTNLADYLMSTSSCSAMVVDENNRKWIGTLGNGLFLLSSDGLREIAHFTTDNAPLLSNDVMALAYDEEGKRLFIASDGGVVVYHSEGISPANDFGSFHCYPNPLRPNYYGNVEIVGIMKDSDVSITDVTGNLIWKSFSTDGKASWDGRGNDGNRVAPGIYLIHGYCDGDWEAKICKLLVL